MTEIRPETSSQKAIPSSAISIAGIKVFDDLDTFAKMALATGFAFDFRSLTTFSATFLEPSEHYLVLSVRDFDSDDPNNILFLNETHAFLYSKRPPSQESFKTFAHVLSKPYGKSTVLAFLTLSKVLTSYKATLESLINRTKDMEQEYDARKYRDLALDFSRLFDRLEDFHEILIRLEERGLKEVESRLISFDYRVLLAQSNSNLDRCRNRFNMLKDLAREYELRTATEMNRRVERLNDVVKRLTAVTVIIMIPTLIASHFGMNFEFMPELSLKWAYPAVLGAQVLVMGVAILLFRKIGWL